MKKLTQIQPVNTKQSMSDSAETVNEIEYNDKNDNNTGPALFCFLNESPYFVHTVSI